MNIIAQIFKDLSDSDLSQMISEIKVSEENGSFENFSKVRELVVRIAELTSSSYSTQLYLVQTALVKEASFRWLASNKWISALDELPNPSINGDKVILFRIGNDAQKSNQITIHDTNMVKYCEPNETWWKSIGGTPLI
jgi:hypothetical protein